MTGRDPVAQPPAADAGVRPWLAALGLPGIVDVHVHFMPERLLRRVWAFFDRAVEHYGVAWPIQYRLPEADRLAALRALGVTAFAPLVYPHRPGMAAELNQWAVEFGTRTDGAVPTATIYPEPGVAGYLDIAIRAGARCVKAHVQVGDYDPRDPLLDAAWGMIAEAGLPVVVHCGHMPLSTAYTGLDVFAEVLRRHPRLTAVLAHAGMPEYEHAVELAVTYPRVYLDTTMVGVPFGTSRPMPSDWPALLVRVADRVVLGSDFPNIPHSYATQLAAICGWAAADRRLGAGFVADVVHHTPARLLGLTG